MHKPSPKPRTWGFRFLFTDALVLCVVSVTAAFFERTDNPLSWLLVIVVAHFFLFCNVFRIRRQFELIWAGLFVINVGVWMLCENLEWLNVLACQIPVTVGVVITEIRSPYYHGIFARQMNRRLNDYLERRIQ